MNGFRCDMRGFFEQTVDVYCDLAKVDKSILRAVSTPPLDDHQIKDAVTAADLDRPLTPGGSGGIPLAPTCFQMCLLTHDYTD